MSVLQIPKCKHGCTGECLACYDEEIESLRQQLADLDNAIKQAKREALLEAAEVWEVIGYSKFKTPSEELRRMAEKT